jgi:hypothetical protein
MALTIHLEICGAPLCILLDVMEVAKPHMGFVLVEEFAQVLDEFRIASKVCGNMHNISKSSHECRSKILSITADNTKTNDTMIDELEQLLSDFPGRVNQMRCFAHIINLIAKTIVKQFDIPKKKPGERSDDEERLESLAEDINVEEIETRMSDVDEEDDNGEGWVDEIGSLSDEERRQLDVDILPIRLVVVKVTSIRS